MLLSDAAVKIVQFYQQLQKLFVLLRCAVCCCAPRVVRYEQ